MSTERKRGMRYVSRTANEPKWKTHSSPAVWAQLINGEMSCDHQIGTAIFGRKKMTLD